MKDEKIVSFIIPTYNAKAYLKKCLDSFLADEEQEDRIEVIVVDDGSTDNSAEIATEYLKKYPEVFRMLKKENGGHGSAINEGTKIAQGRFIKVIDADDWIDKTLLKQYVDELQESDAQVVLTDYQTYDISQRKYRKYTVKVDDVHKMYQLDDLMKNWKDIEWGCTFHGITYRRDFYEKCDVTLTEKVFYEDQEFATIPLCQADQIQILNLALYVYRIGDVNQSVSSINQVKRLSHAEHVIENMMLFGRDHQFKSDGQKAYYEQKIKKFLSSYYLIALLKNKSKKEGRQIVRKFNNQMKKINQNLIGAMKKKYLVYLVMNFFHLSEEAFYRIYGKA